VKEIEQRNGNQVWFTFLSIIVVVDDIVCVIKDRCQMSVDKLWGQDWTFGKSSQMDCL
jgi:hypothetical protein